MYRNLPINPSGLTKKIERIIQSSKVNSGSDRYTGSVLRVLAATKPEGRFLELGTGTGLSTSWILDGMDDHSTITTVDKDEKTQFSAKKVLDIDKRVTFQCSDIKKFIKSMKGEQFDFIFAGGWTDKFSLFKESLSLLATHGVYVVDDILMQLSWPEVHVKHVEQFLVALEKRKDLHVIHLPIASGLLIATKK